MSSIEVTGVITCYNNGKFFAQALQGMLNQTYPVSQIIVVDDVSTDDTRDIIRKEIARYPDANILFIEREVNGGPAGARNSAIEQATGEVIAFCDGDDFYYKNKVMESVKALAENPEVGLVYSDYDMLYEGQNKVQREFKYSYNRDLLWQACIVSTNSVIKAKVFEIVGNFDERFFGTEDYHMWLKISKQLLMIHLPRSLFAYRVHGNNITLDSTKSEQMAKDIALFKKELVNG